MNKCSKKRSTNTTTRGPRHRFICQTRWQRPSEMDQFDSKWNHMVSVYWWCDCWQREPGEWFMDPYSHRQPKGDRRMLHSTTAKAKCNSQAASLILVFCRYCSIFRLSKCHLKKILLACLNTPLKKNNTSIFLWKALLITSVISWLFYFESTGVVWILNTMLTLCGNRHKTEGKEQCRRWVCSKPVFEQEQNAKQATAKQATESSPAERAELKTLAGTTEAALSMWPELKTTYGAFRNSGDPKKKNYML